MLRHTVCCIAFATVLLAFPAASMGADNPGQNPGKDQGQKSGQESGKDSGKTAAQGVPASGMPSPLHLNDAQRETVRKVVAAKHSDIEFQLSETKPAKDFTPAVGATLPKGVEGQALPSEATAEVPELKNYLYVTMKDQVLIVDGLSRKVVDVFPETRPLM